MLELVLFFIGLISTGICSIWDLKTTEIPDWIPIITALLAVALYAYYGYLEKNYSRLMFSVEWGVIFSIVGFILYYFGQWGGGDAEILASLGFLLGGFKRGQLSFAFSYFVNLFFVGAFYMFVYSLYIASKNEKVVLRFKRSLSRSNLFLIVILSLLLFFFSLYYLEVSGINDFYFSVAFVGFIEMSFLFIYLIWIFAKAVEDVGFKKRIPVSKLKVGDVLLTSKKWVGITKKELNKIKRSGKKYVWIKEGVRFAPSFFFALIVTWYFGFWFFYL